MVLGAGRGEVYREWHFTREQREREIARRMQLASMRSRILAIDVGSAGYEFLCECVRERAEVGFVKSPYDLVGFELYEPVFITHSTGRTIMIRSLLDPSKRAWTMGRDIYRDSNFMEPNPYLPFNTDEDREEFAPLVRAVDEVIDRLH